MSCVNIKKYHTKMAEQYRARRVARALRVQSVDEFLADKSDFGTAPTMTDGYGVGQ